MRLLFLFVFVFYFGPALDSASAQWTECNGPYSEIITSIYANGSILFAGTNGGGVLRSSDLGETWEPINNGIYLPAFVTTFSANDSFLFVGMNVFGMFRSSDEGETWVSTDSGLTDPYISSIAILGSTVFASAEESLFRSTDNGSSWNVDSACPPLEYAQLAMAGMNVVVAAAGGVYRSSDSGISWVPADTAFPYFVFSLTVYGSTLFAATDGGLLVSTDLGTTWTSLLPRESVLSVAINGSEIVAGTMGHGILVSSDGGASWVPIDIDSTSRNVYAFATLGTDMYAGTYNGILHASGNFTQWDARNTGVPYGVFVESMSSGGTNVFVATDWNGLYRSSDNGASWENISLDTLAWKGYLYLSSAYSSGNATLITDGYDIWRSSDGGNHWQDVYFPDDVNPYTFALSKDGILFASTSNGIWSSLDTGVTWTALDSAAFSGIEIGPIAISATRLLASAANKIIYSYDNGLTWQDASYSGSVNSFAVLGSNLFGADGIGGLLRSTDSGSTWQSTDTDFEISGGEPKIFAFGSTLFYAANYLYRSIDSGASWQEFDAGIPDPDVHYLTANNQYLFAGTGEDGLWRMPLMDAVVDVPEIIGASAFPNPLSASTTIRFELKDSGSGSVSIYDVLGRKVASLFEGTLNDGSYSFAWDATRMPSGSYRWFWISNPASP